MALYLVEHRDSFTFYLGEGPDWSWNILNHQNVGIDFSTETSVISHILETMNNVPHNCGLKQYLISGAEVMDIRKAVHIEIYLHCSV